MKRLNRIIFSLVVLTGLAVMAFVVTQVVDKVRSNDVKILENLSGAFIGTIFGVGAFIINGWIKAFFDRQREAWNALIQMEANFVFILDEINQNIIGFGESAKHLGKAYLNKPHIIFHEPAFTGVRTLSQDFHKLLSGPLKRMIFLFEMGRDRFAADIPNSEKYLQTILKIYNGNSKERLDLPSLFNSLSNKFFEMEAHLKKFLEEAESILVTIRIMRNNPPPWIWFTLKLNKAFAYVPSDSELSKERAQVRAELIDSKMMSEKVNEKVRKS